MRASLRRYIEGLPDGTIEASSGARVTPAGFVWPATIGRGGHDWEGHGEVVISGHGGLLTIVLSNPRVNRGTDHGTLMVDYPWASSKPEAPIVIAHLTPEINAYTFRVRLSDDGAELFNNYASGAEMAMLRIVTG